MKEFILILLLIIIHLLLIKAENSDNNTINKTNCDSNEDETFFFHENFNDCILNECQEYPEISPGCIICKNHLSEYKKNNTCQRCKYGYFKTKIGKCIYCASEDMVDLLAEDVLIKKMRMDLKLIISFAKTVLCKMILLILMVII